MNEAITVTKAVFEQTQAENARLQAELAEAQAAAAMWKTGADNIARLYEGLKRDAVGLNAELLAARADKAGLIEEIQRDNDVIIQRSAELKAARKVADAADKYDRCECAYSTLRKAVNAWRKSCAKPLSPEKQAVIARTLDKSDEEWEALASQEVEC